MPDPALFETVRQLFAQGRFADAEAPLRAALAESPDDPEATHYLGIALRETGRRDQGNTLLARSLQLAPDRPEFHYHFANTLDADGNLDQAAIEYRRALDLRPKYPQAMMNLGVVLHSLGRTDEAITVLTDLVAIAPRSPSAHLNLGRIYHGQGRFDDAIPLIRRAAELDKKPTTLAFLSNILFVADKDEEAAAVRQQAIDAATASNADAATWMTVGQACGKDQPSAATCFRKVLELKPGDKEAEFLLAVAEGRESGAAPHSYIARTYDNFADNFDRHLVDTLNYQAPHLVHDAVTSLLPPDGPGPTPPLDILDAGSGTGLAAPLFKPLAKTLTGIDLSSNMTAHARRRNLYTDLHVGDLVSFVAGKTAAYDLIISVDVIIHLGDLAPLFKAVANALRPKGLFAFSTETRDIDGFTLLPSGRFAYGKSYFAQLAADNHLTERYNDIAKLRHERNAPIFGTIIVYQKA